MILGSKTHTEGDTRRWEIDYSRWLSNTATIASATAESNSDTLLVDEPTVLGRELVFFIRGGVLGETAIVTIIMTDSFDNIKTDTIHFTVIAP